MSTYRVKPLCSTFGIVLAFLVLFDPAKAFGDPVDLCGRAYPMEVGRAERFVVGEETQLLFSVEAPAAGLLALDSLTPFGSPAATQLTFLGRECGDESAGGLAERLHEFIDGTLIRVRSAGTYHFRVDVLDPSLLLSHVRIEAGFAADEGGMTAPATKDEGGGSGGSGGGDENPIDEILPLPGGTSPAFASLLSAICRDRLADDVGDTYLCASALKPGSRVAGSIRNDWGDDADVYLLKVPHRVTLDLELTGGAGLGVAVYDRYGQAMALRGEAPWSTVRALAPGTYFFRIEGAQGDYTLTVEERGR